MEKLPGEGVLTINYEPSRVLGVGRWSSNAIGTLSCVTCLPLDSRTIERQWPPKNSDFPRRLTAEEANSFAGYEVFSAARLACSHLR